MPILFGTVVFFMTAMPFTVTRFVTWIIILTIHGMCAASIGYCFGCAAPTREIAQMLLPLALMPQMFFAGFMVS